MNYILLHYCEGCKSFTRAPISDRMIEILKEKNASTWVLAKKCPDCLQKEKKRPK